MQIEAKIKSILDTAKEQGKDMVQAKAEVLRRAKQALSVHVQVRLAELLLSAEPGRRLGAAAPGA